MASYTFNLTWTSTPTPTIDIVRSPPKLGTGEAEFTLGDTAVFLFERDGSLSSSLALAHMKIYFEKKGTTSEPCPLNLILGNLDPTNPAIHYHVYTPSAEQLGSPPYSETQTFQAGPGNDPPNESTFIFTHEGTWCVVFEGVDTAGVTYRGKDPEWVVGSGG